MQPITFRASSQTVEIGIATIAPILALAAHQSIGWDPPGLLIVLWVVIAFSAVAWLASAKRVIFDPRSQTLTEQSRFAGLPIRRRTVAAHPERIELRPHWQRTYRSGRSLAYDLVLVSEDPERSITLKRNVQRFRGAEQRLRRAAKALRAEAVIRWSLVTPDVADDRRGVGTGQHAPFALPPAFTDWRRFI